METTVSMCTQCVFCPQLKKPHDVELRMKLLRVYLTSDRVEEAYTNAVETDRTTAFSTCLGWYECLHDVFEVSFFFPFFLCVVSVLLPFFFLI